MKSGLIVYLVGGAELPQGFDLPGQCRDLGYPADHVELAGAGDGFFDVQDAWHFLITRGCGAIRLLVAGLEPERLAPLHPPVRLYG